jgi:hypothetical protein
VTRLQVLRDVTTARRSDEIAGATWRPAVNDNEPLPISIGLVLVVVLALVAVFGGFSG